MRAMMSGVFLVLALAVAQTAADTHPDTPVRVRFGLADGNHAVGFHYWSHRSDLPVLLMIHGASDTHTVFDFAPRYRAAPQIARHGYPVLALDRVGYGESSRPGGDTLNFTTAAGYVHEVIQALRAELQSALNNASAPFRAQVMAPVLLLQANHDHIFVPQDDSNLFSGSPDVTYALLEDAGHKAFQHKTSRHPAVHTILEWLDDRFRAMHRSGNPQ